MIQGCLKNDRKAQEELYKRFYPAMMSLCLRYLPDPEDAVETLNDAFLKIFGHIGRYDSARTNLYTWMRTILINTTLDVLRKQKVSREREANTADVEEAGIDNDAISKFNGDELLAMIRRLPSTPRSVFNLFVVDGYTHREIAAMLRISEGTSRWYLNEARRQLKQILNPTEPKS